MSAHAPPMWPVALFAIGVPEALIALGGDPAWLLLGIVAWIGAFALKLPVMAGVALVTRSARATVQAAFMGLASASIELGVALLALAMGPTQLRPADLLLFATARDHQRLASLVARGRSLP
jgi:hypothetical protein